MSTKPTEWMKVELWGDTDLVLLGQQILTADGESGGDDSLEDGREL